MVTLRESNNGYFHYDLSRGSAEDAKFSRSSSPVIEAGARNERTDSGAANSNIALHRSEINDSTLPRTLRTVAAAVLAELKTRGIAGAIKSCTVR